VNTTNGFLECPCCGCEGAESSAAGMFFDGQPLICGCSGHVSVDLEDDGVWISISDEPCPPTARCHS
jgi:hypothetical protein